MGRGAIGGVGGAEWERASRVSCVVQATARAREKVVGRLKVCKACRSWTRRGGTDVQSCDWRKGGTREQWWRLGVLVRKRGGGRVQKAGGVLVHLHLQTDSLTDHQGNKKAMTAAPVRGLTVVIVNGQRW